MKKQGEHSQAERRGNKEGLGGGGSAILRERGNRIERNREEEASRQVKQWIDVMALLTRRLCFEQGGGEGAPDTLWWAARSGSVPLIFGADALRALCAVHENAARERAAEAAEVHALPSNPNTTSTADPVFMFTDA